MKFFRDKGRHDKILALLVEGEPSESFPKALGEMRTTVEKDGQLVEVAPGGNLGPEDGARLLPGVVQMGLTTRELKKLRERIRELLEDVDAGKIQTF